MQYPIIPFVMTTCKRFALFKRTIESFLDCCLDKDLISTYIFGDDGSSKDDVGFMQGYGTVLRNLERGHANNLAHLYGAIHSEWAFHCEDDWLFQKSGHFIREAFDIVNANDMIKQVAFFRSLRDAGVEDKGSYEIQEFARYAGADHPTFSLNPCVVSAYSVKSIGGFRSVPWFELDVGRRFKAAGFLRANTKTDYVTHIGADHSAYPLNGTER